MRSESDFVFSYNINEKVLKTFDKYQEYLYYKNNPLVIEEDKFLEIKIISLLEEMGFPLTEVGTYFYVEVIIKIVNIIIALDESKKIYMNKLEEKDIINSSRQELINNLDNLTSSFYLELSNREINLSLFHSYIRKSILVKNSEKENKDEIVKKEQISYGKLAYRIANFIIDNDVLLYEDFDITIPKDKAKILKLY